MKLLFDQNISFRIVKKIEALFPLSHQVKLLGLENSDDYKIWEYAKTNNYSIVTFDTDFYDLSLIKGIPTKIIWLRTGNTSTDALAKLLEQNASLIKNFIEHEDNKTVTCLEIYD